MKRMPRKVKKASFRIAIMHLRMLLLYPTVIPMLTVEQAMFRPMITAAPMMTLTVNPTMTPTAMSPMMNRMIRMTIPRTAEKTGVTEYRLNMTVTPRATLPVPLPCALTE